MQLKQKIDDLKRSGMAKGLLAWSLEKQGKEQEAGNLWVQNYCLLPLGIDIESMRDYIKRFIETIKKREFKK